MPVGQFGRNRGSPPGPDFGTVNEMDHFLAVIEQSQSLRITAGGETGRMSVLKGSKVHSGASAAVFWGLILECFG